MIRHTLLATLLIATAAACAVRLGGPSPLPVRVVAIHADQVDSPDAIAERIRAEGGEFVLVTADQDSTWFARLATASGLQLSGPGTTGPRGMAFLTGSEILGDTSIVLLVPSGGRIHMHDALFQIEEERNIDLMFIDVIGVENLQDGVRTLLSYIATDVGNNIPLIIGVTAQDVEVDDTVASMIRAAFSSARDCADDASAIMAATERLHLLYGPPARLRCESAAPLPGDAGVTARLVVGR